MPELEDDELVALPYVADSERFARLFKIIMDGTVVEVLDIKERSDDER